MDVAELLEGLDADQREAVQTDASPLAILAPAGSGKTRVLSHRIARRVADGSADAEHVLAITFTRRAAGELQRRLAALGLRARPTAGTFHGVAWSVLAQRWSDLGRPRPDLLADKHRVLGPLLDELPAARSRSARFAPRLGDVAAELDWARARLVTPASYALEADRHGRRPPLGPETMAQLMAAYEDTKRRRRLVDFDDLLEQCARELQRDEAFAAAQRWRFRHLFVDEFQDVNPLQFALLEAWRGGRPDLCVVGDPNQAIYGWNGADPTLLARFPELVGGATVVRLATTYRSTPQVVATAGALLGADAANRPRPVRADGPPPKVHAFATDADEATGIARLLAAHRPGRRWSSSAVLVRTHAQLPAIERALTAAGIPSRLRSDQPLLDRPAVQRALRAAEPSTPLRDFADDLRVEPLDADDPSAPADFPGVAQLAGLAAELLATTPAATVATFRAWLLAGGADAAERADGVELLTFHSAKGLEWPLVVVAGVETGLVPHASARGQDGVAEEVRLLYVALTRAEHELHVTWAAARGRGARRPRRPSPLLAAIVAGADPGPPAPPPPELLADPPARVVTAPPDDVLITLQAWRATAALAAAVPEHAVCTDDELARLAAARPATEAELAEVLGPLAARRLAPRLLPLLSG